MTIHVLHRGRSYCEMPGIPGEWPAGHRWVSVRYHKHADCQQCLKKLSARSMRCYLCDAVLVDSDGHLVAESRSATLGPHCYPQCPEKETADEP